MDEGFSQVTVGQFVRALDEGFYDSVQHEVVVVPPPEVGGNGVIVGTIVEWLLRHAPDVAYAYVGTKATDRVLSAKSGRLQRLSADWAAQRISSPFQLRIWIDRKGEWFPETLGTRLAIPSEAAERLLIALGYEKNEHGLMLRCNTPDALERRHQWMIGEHETFMSQFDEEEGWENAFIDDPIARPSAAPRLKVLLRRLRFRRG